MQHEQADATPDVRIIVEGIPKSWDRHYQGEGLWVLLEDREIDEPDWKVVDILLRRHNQPRMGGTMTDRLRARAYWRIDDDTTREEVTEVTDAVRVRWAHEDYTFALAQVARARAGMKGMAARLATAGHTDEEIHNLLGAEDDITAAAAAARAESQRLDEVQRQMDAEPLAEWERELLEESAARSRSWAGSPDL